MTSITQNSLHQELNTAATLWQKSLSVIALDIVIMIITFQIHKNILCSTRHILATQTKQASFKQVFVQMRKYIRDPLIDAALKRSRVKRWSLLSCGDSREMR